MFDIGTINAESKGVQTAKVKHQVTNEEIEVRYDFGSDLQDAIAKFGDEVVFSNFCVGAKTALRNKLYSLTHDADKPENCVTAEAAVQALADWKPGVAGSRSAADPLEKLAAKFASATQEEKLAKLEQIKALLGI